jgi:serine protease AprX
VNAIWVRGNLPIVQAMAERSDVNFIYPTGSGALSLPGGIEAEESSTLSVGSNIAWVKADQVWALGYTGQGVVVAGADTGVAWTHNALKNKYRGWNGTTVDHNYNWHDAIKNPNTGCPGSSPEPCDDDVLLGGGHGTHTVGTMVGDDGGTNQIGMAPGAEWIACRNMNNGVGAVPTYLECMEWFIAPTDANGNNPDPSKAPHVINNSWGCVEGCASPS